MAFLGPIGTPELIIIMIVLLLLFGARRLPEMGRSIGRGMREFKDAVTGDEKPSSEPEPEPEPAELPPASESRSPGAKTDTTPAESTERETVP